MDEIEKELQKSNLTDEIHWEDYEYDFIEREPEWYWLLGTIAALIMVLALILKDMLLAVIVLLGAIIIGMYSKRPPRLIPFAISRRGIKIGHDLYLYETIRSFWVNEQRRQLVIETERMVKPHIVIPLGNMDPSLIKNRLEPILEEKTHSGSFTDAIADFFGI